MARVFPAGSVPGKEVLGIHKLTLHYAHSHPRRWLTEQGSRYLNLGP